MRAIGWTLAQQIIITPQMRQITPDNINIVIAIQTIAQGDIGKRELTTGKIGACGKLGIGYRQHGFNSQQRRGNRVMVNFISWRANQFPEKGHNENMTKIPFCPFGPFINLRPRCCTFWPENIITVLVSKITQYLSRFKNWLAITID